MARVAALIPDLLFGSKVKGALEAAGHDVAIVSGDAAAWDQSGAQVLVIDLTVDDAQAVAYFSSLADAGKLDGVRTLGFFAHTRPEIRDRAMAAGFDEVVPRSRMAREGAELVARLAT
jgi:hypothetical protein